MAPTFRRPHRKTRTGCIVCKSRKIKCDEKKPSCENCIKYARTCEYASTPATHTPNSQADSSAAIESTRDQTPNSLNDVSFSQMSEFGTEGGQELNLCHLELFHNFITTTSDTLHNHPSLRILWRINAPQMGFKYDFVMDAILALSALQLARIKPDQSDFYVAKANSLHQNGLSKATNLMPQVNRENCSALYIFAALTCFITLATPRDEKDILLVEETRVASWISLFRGTISLIAISDHDLRSGPFGPMFDLGHIRVHQRESGPPNKLANERLRKLQDYIEEATEDRTVLETYIKTIEELRRTYLVVFCTDIDYFEPGDIFLWLFRMPEEYLGLLQQRTQESLAILAHYCVLLNHFDDIWYVSGWGFHLMNRIYLLLDERHRTWVQWPVDEIGGGTHER